MKKQITIDYDEEADTLYLSLGDPVEAITEEIGNVGIRVNERTNEIVGVTIIDFIKIFRKNHEPIQLSR